MTPKKDTATPRRPLTRMVRRQKLHARAASRGEIDEFESEAEPGMKLSQAFIVVLLLHVLAVGGIYAFNQIKSVSKAAPVVKAMEKAEPIAKPAPLDDVSEPLKPVASVPTTNAGASASAESGRKHSVIAGDTLHRIAGVYGVDVASIEKANGLENNSIIKVGQILAIPDAGTTSTGGTTSNSQSPVVAKTSQPAPATEKTIPAESKPAPEKTVTQSPASKTYTVSKGDNPYSIAKKLNVNPIKLMKVNKIDDPRKLQIGQKLVMP
jgi:LysM repeat protein